VCHQILFAAVKLDASDVHIEPGPAGVRVRLRIDGMLREYLDLPVWMKRQLLSRLKVLAHLDIAQQRMPQDGRIKARGRDGAIDLRVSTLPTQYGEKIVLRVLGSSHAPSLLDLGLSAQQLAVRRPGAAPASGIDPRHRPDRQRQEHDALFDADSPAGARRQRRHGRRSDRAPAAGYYAIAGQRQDGTTFSRYLRAILRQDPDVIMIGEIRDLESAEIAFQAALTGHLVLTTLHTNGTVEAVDRLLDIGVKPLMITSVTQPAGGSALARLICPHCRVRYQPSPARSRHSASTRAPSSRAARDVRPAVIRDIAAASASSSCCG
jgi:type IV pilus assembly protein PilB